MPFPFFKKEEWHRRFLLNFAKILGTYFLKQYLWWLLFKVTITTQRRIKDVSKIYNEHCVKSIRIRSYSGPHFSAFRLNMEKGFYAVEGFQQI